MANLKLKIPSDVIKIHKAFKKNGKKLYVVGGAVRDAILGKSPKDFDVATDAKPDEVEKIAKDNGIPTKLVGKRFGVVIWIINGEEYEIATFRKDIGKGRRPDSVDYTDIHGDVKRRDLTVNALFYDIDRKEIVDLVGGIEDLKKKKIRTVGKAKERFDEDPLRKLRALRFWTRLGGTLDKELLDALQNDPSLKGVSSEAIRIEFLKSIQSSKNTKDFLEMCDKVGFTSQILPNLKVSKPYPKTTDYILLLAWILRKNSPIVLKKILNKINYTNKEVEEIVYLNTLQNFTPEKVSVYKKGQSKADDSRIIMFGKMIGKDFKKFIKFKLSVKGGDVPSDIKGPAIGLWMANKEKENYLNEGLKEMGITDFKSLFKKMPSDLQKRVYNLKNFGQRVDKHPEGNVLKHTITVVNRSIKEDDIDIAIAAMFHDIGKDETAGIHPKKGHITHFGHEKVSANLVKKYRNWIESVGGNTANVYYIVKNHMRFKQLDNMRIQKVMKLKAFRAFDKLGKFSKHDRSGLDVNEISRNPGESDEDYNKRVATYKAGLLRNEPYHIKGEALTPAQKLARKRKMAGKQKMIQRKRQRAMLRKKGFKQLFKKAQRAAYKDVYELFRTKLFPDVPKSELTIIQKKQIAKKVAMKKGKVMKRARFIYLPKFREEEKNKFKKD
jgi:tRNA nucleotidyltransferase/poly(A) polymerase